MVTAINANAVNLTSVSDAVLRKCMADSNSSVGVTAKELTADPCIVMLSVIMSLAANVIGRIGC